MHTLRQETKNWVPNCPLIVLQVVGYAKPNLEFKKPQLKQLPTETALPRESRSDP